MIIYCTQTPQNLLGLQIEHLKCFGHVIDHFGPLEYQNLTNKLVPSSLPSKYNTSYVIMLLDSWYTTKRTRSVLCLVTPNRTIQTLSHSFTCMTTCQSSVRLSSTPRTQYPFPISLSSSYILFVSPLMSLFVYNKPMQTHSSRTTLKTHKQNTLSLLVSEKVEEERSQVLRALVQVKRV